MRRRNITGFGTMTIAAQLDRSDGVVSGMRCGIAQASRSRATYCAIPKASGWTRTAQAAFGGT
jgi:hypothetical protein